MTGVDDAQLERLADLVADRVAAGRPRGLVDTAGAADLLGVPESWLAARARNGEAPCRRLGKYVRFDVTELRSWIDRTASSGPGAGLELVPAVADHPCSSDIGGAGVPVVPPVVPRRAA